MVNPELLGFQGVRSSPPLMVDCTDKTYRERGMARFYVLLDGEVTQSRAEESIRDHMAPHTVEFDRTEWFSTFDGK